MDCLFYIMTSQQTEILFRNARMIKRDGSIILADIILSGEKIHDILPPGEGMNYMKKNTGMEIIECDNKFLLPGLVDMHVHFREPGFEYKETIEGGSLAAAAGGFTIVCTMPNLKPAPDSPENLLPQLKAIIKEENKTGVEILPYATITEKRMGNKCVDFHSILAYSKKEGFRIAGFSDDGSGIQEERPMREALEASAKEGFLVAAHCEVNSLLKGGYIHAGTWASSHGMKGICSESEWKEVERDIKLAEETGGHIHICHISTKESVELVRRGKERGVHVTCETAPHYLLFCDEDLKDEGRFKMNPPLRSSLDREELRKGIADGTIDVIATDHAPHSEEEKSRGLEHSAMGIVGLETSLAAVYTVMVKSGLIDLKRLIELMSLNPRKLLKMSSIEDGELKPGNYADFTLVDFEKSYKVDSDKFRGKGRATPFEGLTLWGKIEMTMRHGRILYRNHEK